MVSSVCSRIALQNSLRGLRPLSKRRFFFIDLKLVYVFFGRFLRVKGGKRYTSAWICLVQRGSLLYFEFVLLFGGKVLFDDWFPVLGLDELVDILTFLLQMPFLLLKPLVASRDVDGQLFA